MSVDFWGGKKVAGLERFEVVGGRDKDGLLRVSRNHSNGNAATILRLLNVDLSRGDLYGEMPIANFMARMTNARSTLKVKAEKAATETCESQGRGGCRVVALGVSSEDIIDKFERLQGFVDEAFGLGAEYIIWG